MNEYKIVYRYPGDNNVPYVVTEYANNAHSAIRQALKPTGKRLAARLAKGERMALVITRTL